MAENMTMIHIEKDGKDQTAHIVSLDLPMDDSSVMTFTWHSSQGKKAERTEGVLWVAVSLHQAETESPVLCPGGSLLSLFRMAFTGVRVGSGSSGPGETPSSVD